MPETKGIDSLHLTFDKTVIFIKNVTMFQSSDEVRDFIKEAEPWLKRIAFRDYKLAIDYYNGTPPAFRIFLEFITQDSSEAYRPPELEAPIYDPWEQDRFMRQYMWPPQNAIHRFTVARVNGNLTCCCWLDEERFIKLIRAFIFLVNQHEIDEAFKIDGTSLEHPHRPVYNPLVTRIEI